jgi:hypothetical protein
MGAEKLDIVVKGIQADAKRIQLLQILGQQLELLINESTVTIACSICSKTEAMYTDITVRPVHPIFLSTQMWTVHLPVYCSKFLKFNS